jgi:two-component system, response regulator / RNA-binding antiterminator
MCKVPINVLIVDDSRSRASLLKRSVKEFGFHPVVEDSLRAPLCLRVTQAKPDLLIISVGTLATELLEDLIQINQTAPLPVVIFAESNTPEMIQQVIHAGVSAYVVDDLQPIRVGTILEIALARFAEQQKLRQELAQTQEKLAERKVVEVAKGLLMQHKHMTEYEAYQCLRKLSMDTGKPMTKVADNIVEVLSLLSETSA